jgi:hypothetical protein
MYIDCLLISSSWTFVDDFSDDGESFFFSSSSIDCNDGVVGMLPSRDR